MRDLIRDVIGTVAEAAIWIKSV